MSSVPVPGPPQRGAAEPGRVDGGHERAVEEQPAADDGEHRDLVGDERPEPAVADDRADAHQHRDRDRVAEAEQQPDGHRAHGLVTGVERAYFGAVAALAAWVGLTAYPTPADAVLPFAVPALHGRVIGALYLCGLAYLVAAMLARRWAHVAAVPAIVAIWTGGLLIVTLLHLDAFDFGLPETQIWFAAYLAYPVIGIWILVRRRGDDTVAAEPDAVLGVGVRRALAVQGGVVSALAVAMALAPAALAAGWPWPIMPLLVQVYAAPFLGLGVGSLLVARSRSRAAARVVEVGVGLFGVLALVASMIHRNLFDAARPATWIWFGALAAVTVLAVVLVAPSRRAQ